MWHTHTAGSCPELTEIGESNIIQTQNAVSSAPDHEDTI